MRDLDIFKIIANIILVEFNNKKVLFYFALKRIFNVIKFLNQQFILNYICESYSYLI